MSELYEENTEEVRLKEKEILLVRMDDSYTAAEVTQIINEIDQNINGEDEEFTSPVLFLDRSVEVEKLSIGRLEHILEQAKSVVEDGRPTQEEVEFHNDELEGVEVEEEEDQVKVEDIPEELNELVPKEVRDQNQNNETS